MSRIRSSNPLAGPMVVLLVLTVALVTGCSSLGGRAETATRTTIGSRAVDTVDTVDTTTSTSVEPGPNPADDRSDGRPTIAADVDPAVEPVMLDEDAEVVAEPCGDTATRCGMVLVPQVEGSPDLVAIPFEEWTDGRDGTPLVVLDWNADDPLDGDDFPGRPVVIIGDRDNWSGGPGLACPGFDAAIESTIEPTPESIGERAAACRRVLEDGGFDLDGAGLRARVAEVGTVISALGHGSVSVVAAGAEVDVVAGLAAVLDVDRAIYVNPVLTGDAVGPSAAVTLVDSYAEASSQCEGSPRCEVSGSLDDLLVAVAGLDADPLPDPWNDAEVIDGSAVLDRLLLLDDASGFSDLPDVHRAVLARDVDLVKAFLVSIPFQAVDHRLVSTCRLPSPQGDATVTADVPDYLADHALDRAARHRAFCQGLGITPGQRPVPVPGLVIETRPWNSSHEDRADIGPVVIEPTVGWPSRWCLAGAVAAYLDDGSVDDAGCRTGMRFATRDDAISLVESSMFDEYVERTVTLVVPESWLESWPGSWSRLADPSDVASLSVYLWEVDDVELLLEDYAWEYEVVDWERSTSDIGGRTWETVRGVAGQDSLILATAEVDGTDVIFEMWADPSDADRLTAEVLEPAMGSVAVEAPDIGE